MSAAAGALLTASAPAAAAPGASEWERNQRSRRDAAAKMELDGEVIEDAATDDGLGEPQSA
eukprot:8542782-Pyramimonas_sp.AAC.1